MQETGRITLIHSPAGWFAKFRGQAAEEIRFAFGTDTIPTAYTAAAESRKVKAFIQSKWPFCIVRFEGEE